METLRDSINQLIEKGLKMEQKNQEEIPPQDPRLQQKIEEDLDRWNQPSQPYPEEEEENSQTEAFQELPEKTKIFTLLKNLLLKVIRLGILPLE